VVCEHSTCACGNSLAAPEFQKDRIHMAQCSSQSRQKDVEVGVYEHCCPDRHRTFHHIHYEYENPRFLTEDTECIGSSDIPAPMFPQVDFVEPFPDEKAERYCPDQVTEYQQWNEYFQIKNPFIIRY